MNIYGKVKLSSKKFACYTSATNFLLVKTKIKSKLLQKKLLNLQNSDFRDSKISYSTFLDSDLSGTNFIDVYPIETSFENVIITKESKINTCLEHDLSSKILNKILREIRSNNFNFLNIFEKSIIQLCLI